MENLRKYQHMTIEQMIEDNVLSNGAFTQDIMLELQIRQGELQQKFINDSYGIRNSLNNIESNLISVSNYASSSMVNLQDINNNSANIYKHICQYIINKEATAKVNIFKKIISKLKRKKNNAN